MDSLSWIQRRTRLSVICVNVHAAGNIVYNGDNPDRFSRHSAHAPQSWATMVGPYRPNV